MDSPAAGSTKSRRIGTFIIRQLGPNLDISNAGDSGHVEAFDVSWNTQKGVLASSITLRN